MKIAVLKERRESETRVAATPETIRKLIDLGFEVKVEKGAGERASMPDAAYREAGAAIAQNAETAAREADIVLKVRAPFGAAEPGPNKLNEVALMKKGAILVCLLDPYGNRPLVDELAAAGISAVAMELMPRITRAQSMDVLSSQANLAGYKAVIEAANAFGRAFPMMMTAAGTVPPARAMVMGAGVAGLQAIATARRLGAIVSATDVRPAVKEQVESLGASFVMVDSAESREAETAGGYAREMSEDYKKAQAELIAHTLKSQDIAVLTALIPGRPAPTLVDEAMVKSMKPGSVIVDLAVEQGGNCPLSKPGKVVQKHGVTIIGHVNMPGRLPVDSSRLYARNLLNFLTPLADKETGGLALDREGDDIVKGTLVTHDGRIVHANFSGSE